VHNSKEVAYERGNKTMESLEKEEEQAYSKRRKNKLLRSHVHSLLVVVF